MSGRCDHDEPEQNIVVSWDGGYEIRSGFLQVRGNTAIENCRLQPYSSANQALPGVFARSAV